MSMPERTMVDETLDYHGCLETHHNETSDNHNHLPQSQPFTKDTYRDESVSEYKHPSKGF